MIEISSWVILFFIIGSLGTILIGIPLLTSIIPYGKKSDINSYTILFLIPVTIFIISIVKLINYVIFNN